MNDRFIFCSNKNIHSVDMNSFHSVTLNPVSFRNVNMNSSQPVGENVFNVKKII